MSSAQESHLLPPPKPKLSPLDLRNTDLVSRLLAATPPYLYNMSLLPNTYFFSEMLRSFVQAKNEHRGNIGNGLGANNMYYGHHNNVRRSRKRAWSNLNRENYSQNVPTIEEKLEKPTEKSENEPWMIKSTRKSEENAMELIASSTTSVPHQKLDELHQKPPKMEDAPLPFPPPHQESSSNLVLPPPPPVWYPPIYPTPPYGIDPLHFFIDLRVSGHIYDRQHAKDGISRNMNQENSTVVSEKESSIDKKDIKSEEIVPNNLLNQKRHCSAFSVPNSSLSKRDKPQTKFDVKSMGFDKSCNQTSTNYVMKNISSIYSNFAEKLKETTRAADLMEDSSTINVEADDNSLTAKVSSDISNDESEAEKQKKVKDLRALIGLELVVDYMSHKKSVVRSEESSSVSEGEISSELESCGSPQLEVVAVNDEI